MSPSHATKGNRRYRYYVCGTANKRGWDACPSKSIPAAEIERFVVEQIKCIGRDPALVRETIAQAERQSVARLAELEAEQRQIHRDLHAWNSEIQRLVMPAKSDDSPALARLADLQMRIRDAERRVGVAGNEIEVTLQNAIAPEDVAQALGEFDLLWASLTPGEQCRIVQLLVERVDYDGSSGRIAISFHPTGIKTLAEQLAGAEENAA
jgi:site-specific DNA recombinase